MAAVTVPKLLDGGTVVCIGGGPSLTREDVEFCRGKAFVIAINNAYQLAPWADVLYACDDRWWEWHPDALAFAGLKYSLTAKRRAGVIALRNTGLDGLEDHPSGLRTGLNSGYQAINLAVHLGAARILLLGYDMQKGKGPNASHWFGSHPDRYMQPPVDRFIPYFTSLVKPLQALGISVVNCSRSTALTCFPREQLELALAQTVAA